MEVVEGMRARASRLGNVADACFVAGGLALAAGIYVFIANRGLTSSAASLTFSADGIEVHF